MIMQSVVMYSELDVFSAWFVDGENAVSVAVISDSELLFDVLEEYDVRDRSLIEPYFSAVFDVCFLVGF